MKTFRLTRKTSSRLTALLAFSMVAAIVIPGCSAGMAPQGPSREEAQKNFESMDPQHQIAVIQHSPLPDAEKQKRIAALQQKMGAPK